VTEKEVLEAVQDLPGWDGVVQELKAERRAEAASFAPSDARLPSGLRHPGIASSGSGTMGSIIPICGCRQGAVYTPDAGRTWQCADCMSRLEAGIDS
jgi:hypothetical protein